MEDQTVRKRIFISNARMTLTSIFLIVVVNIIIVKVYWESIEQEWVASLQAITDISEIKKLIVEWTLHQQSFYFLMIIDILLCVSILLFTSFLFTKRLTNKIYEPLNALQNGAKRIQENLLTQEIQYHGDKEFEEICFTFNEMQNHILEEKAKNKMYEKKRTEMIACISHDLKTPVTVIRGCIKAIQDGIIKDENKVQQFLNTAYQRSEEIDVLLNQLFYVSKLDFGSISYDLKPVSLLEWMQNYISDKKKTDDVNINFEYTIVQSDKVLIDSISFGRIFDNLIENSKKYAYADELRIDIRLQKEKEEAVITVKDNGVGVPQDKLASIFDIFYRVDSSRNDRSGSGLGLYIVKSLVEAMNGTISARNENGLMIEMRFCTMVNDHA